MIVIKRDGREVEFEQERINNAIFKAFIDVDNEISEHAKRISNNISNKISLLNIDKMSVEEIQNYVENELMATDRKDVARAYINYRYLRNIARNHYKELMDSVGEKLTASNVQNQNANVDERSFGGRISEAADVVSKHYTINYLLSDMSKNNHINNEIYIHDLNSYAVGNHNCLSIPFDDLLKNGFNTRQTDVRAAQSINTAFQLIAVIFQIQSLQQFGGVSATHLDWTMVPYVRKSFAKHFKDGVKYLQPEDDVERIPNSLSFDDPEANDPHNVKAYQYAMEMTEREARQAVEGMYHNLNTLQSRSGNQLPFSSINYGTCTLPEGRMITRIILEALIDGVGKLHKTSVFPCGIFQCMKGVNRKPRDKNYDLFKLALKATSRRLYPNYANCNWTGNYGYDPNDPRTIFSTMGKRKLSSCKIF